MTYLSAVSSFAMSSHLTTVPAGNVAVPQGKVVEPAGRLDVSATAVKVRSFVRPPVRANTGTSTGAAGVLSVLLSAL